MDTERLYVLRSGSSGKQYIRIMRMCSHTMCNQSMYMDSAILFTLSLSFLLSPSFSFSNTHTYARTHKRTHINTKDTRTRSYTLTHARVPSFSSVAWSKEAQAAVLWLAPYIRFPPPKQYGQTTLSRTLDLFLVISLNPLNFA